MQAHLVLLMPGLLRYVDDMEVDNEGVLMTSKGLAIARGLNGHLCHGYL